MIDRRLVKHRHRRVFGRFDLVAKMADPHMLGENLGDGRLIGIEKARAGGRGAAIAARLEHLG